MMVLGTRGKYHPSDMAERIATLADEIGLLEIHEVGNRIVLVTTADETPKGSRFLFELQGNESAPFVQALMQNGCRMSRSEKNIRYQSIIAIGCLCCLINTQTGFFKPTGLKTEQHHLNGGGHAGQKRRPDGDDIGLCGWHHRGSFNESAMPGGYSGMVWADGKAAIHGPSWAQGSKKFHNDYPSDDVLLEFQNNLIAKLEAA